MALLLLLLTDIYIITVSRNWSLEDLEVKWNTDALHWLTGLSVVLSL